MPLACGNGGVGIGHLASSGCIYRSAAGAQSGCPDLDLAGVVAISCSDVPKTGLLDSHLSAVIVFAFAAARRSMAATDQWPVSRARRRPRVLMRLSMMFQFSVLRYSRLTDICVRQSP